MCIKCQNIKCHNVFVLKFSFQFSFNKPNNHTAKDNNWWCDCTFFFSTVLIGQESCCCFDGVAPFLWSSLFACVLLAASSGPATMITTDKEKHSTLGHLSSCLLHQWGTAGTSTSILKTPVYAWQTTLDSQQLTIGTCVFPFEAVCIASAMFVTATLTSLNSATDWLNMKLSTSLANQH